MSRRPGSSSKNVTLRDVARITGVTPMTVSNVLHGRPGAVGRKTAERVLEAIEQLGYRPHAAAQRLRDNRTNTIGMVIRDDAPDFLSDPFTTNMVAGVANYATRYGKSLLLQGLNSSHENQATLLTRLETDGICVLTSGPAAGSRSLLERLQGLRQPIVLLQERVNGPDVCCILQDDRSGGRLIAERIVGKGARNLFMLLPSARWPAMSEREAGVVEVSTSAGVKVRQIYCGNESLQDTYAAVQSAIEAYGVPDAIIGGNDRMAISALKVLHNAGLAVPDDVMVTGFNAFESAQYATPPLTTIRSRAYEMGIKAGEVLLQRLEAGHFAQREIIFPVELVVGASG